MPCTQSSLLLGSTAPDSPSCHPPTRQASPMTMFYVLRASLSPRDTEFSELGGSFPVLPRLVLAGACWPGTWPHPLAPPPRHLHWLPLVTRGDCIPVPCDSQPTKRSCRFYLTPPVPPCLRVSGRVTTAFHAANCRPVRPSPGPMASCWGM